MGDQAGGAARLLGRHAIYAIGRAVGVVHFRLYGPTQPYFNRSWVLSDIEMIE